MTRNTSYDQLGNVVAADLNCCQRKTWTYSTTTKYAYPDSITRGSSSPTLTTSATYDLNMGLVSTATDENLQITTNTYDAFGRVTDVQRPDTKHIVYAYDDTNHTVQVTFSVQGTDVVRQKTFVDGLGRNVKQQILDVNNTSYSIVETQYDAVGRACKVSNPHNSTAQYWTETRYDALGRVTKTIQPDSGQATFTYSLNTGITSDPAGKQHQAQADGLGRLTAVFEPDTANGNTLTQQTSYAYNVFDALTGVTQGVQTRAYVYDALGRLTDSTTPESGHFQFQYNSYNLMTQRTDARGVITTYGYDTLNRPTTVTYNVGSTGVPATSGTTVTYGTNRFWRAGLLTFPRSSRSDHFDISHDLQIPIPVSRRAILNLSNSPPFNALPARSNDTQKVIDTHCTSVLFFPVFACTEPEVFTLFTPLALSLEGSFEGSPDPWSRSCREVPIKISVDPPALTIFHFQFSIFPVPPNLFRINTYEVPRKCWALLTSWAQFS